MQQRTDIFHVLIKITLHSRFVRSPESMETFLVVSHVCFQTNPQPSVSCFFIHIRFDKTKSAMDECVGILERTFCDCHKIVWMLLKGEREKQKLNSVIWSMDGPNAIQIVGVILWKVW